MFCRKRKINPKIHIEAQKPQGAKAILSKKRAMQVIS
jgi:hypothetical protein